MRQKLALTLGVVFVGLAGCGVLDERRRIEISISPQSVELGTSSTAQFKGTETTTVLSSTTINLQSDSFYWTLEEGTTGGTLEKKANDSVHYVYTAPSVAGTYHIRIQSKQDPSQVARATIIVN